MREEKEKLKREKEEKKINGENKKIEENIKNEKDVGITDKLKFWFKSNVKI